jgi:hypothetical protein
MTIASCLSYHLAPFLDLPRRLFYLPQKVQKQFWIIGRLGQNN